MMTTTSPNIVGVSLGMVVIDEVRIPNKPPLRDLIGGSGSWATLGQRLFATESASVGCLVVAGKDFPETAKSEFERWGLTLVVRGRENETSTRGLLIYEDDKFGREHLLAIYPGACTERLQRRRSRTPADRSSPLYPIW